MRARPHRDALAIDHHCHIMRMDPGQLEGHDRALARRPAEDAKTINGREALVAIVREVGFMRGDPLATNGFHIVDRRRQSDRLYDRWSAGIKAVRRMIVADLILADVLDHFSAALKGSHLLEHFPAPVQYADPGRAVELVAGEHIEISAKIAHIHRDMH